MFATVAVNVCVPASETVAVTGITETLTPVPAWMVTVADPDLVVSAADVAVTVTTPDGTAAGAVYMPVEFIVP